MDRDLTAQRGARLIVTHTSQSHLYVCSAAEVGRTAVVVRQLERTHNAKPKLIVKEGKCGKIKLRIKLVALL